MDNVDKFILLTGGAGYIGSHICLEIFNTMPEYKIIIVDKKIDHNNTVIKYLKETIKDKLILKECSLLNFSELCDIFSHYNHIESVIHLASFKSVPESLRVPLIYYNNNLIGTINLLKCMNIANCFNLIFSSSACVYGDTKEMPITEDSQTAGKQTNPYGKTKIMIEEMLSDLCNSSPNWKIIILRYFNPVGSELSGNIGDYVKLNTSNNLFLNIQENYKACYMESNSNIFANTLQVYGDDYNTKDGSCIRDFIHIMDLANAHVKSINYLNNIIVNVDNNTTHIFNIGTGKGYTVLEVLKKFNDLTNGKIKYNITKRRKGDAEVSYTDNKKAKEILKWEPKYDLDEMVSTTIKWADKQLSA